MKPNHLRSRQTLSPDATATLQHLGENLRIARLRRGESQALLARRITASRMTIQRLEKGDPGVTLAVLVSTLKVYGLLDHLTLLANPDTDPVGLALEKQKRPKRAQKTSLPDFNSKF